ncbi:MAG: hypothetical protein PHU12_02690 [Candidatus Aenigmarchaeota archaeon]|nr:hypothetical protein [Candidatus Aenigmarchaeota archaeon]
MSSDKNDAINSGQTKYFFEALGDGLTLEQAYWNRKFDEISKKIDDAILRNVQQFPRTPDNNIIAHRQIYIPGDYDVRPLHQPEDENRRKRTEKRWKKTEMKDILKNL